VSPCTCTSAKACTDVVVLSICACISDTGHIMAAVLDSGRSDEEWKTEVEKRWRMKFAPRSSPSLFDEKTWRGVYDLFEKQWRLPKGPLTTSKPRRVFGRKRGDEVDLTLFLTIKHNAGSKVKKISTRSGEEQSFVSALPLSSPSTASTHDAGEGLTETSAHVDVYAVVCSDDERRVEVSLKHDNFILSTEVEESLLPTRKRCRLLQKNSSSVDINDAAAFDSAFTLLKYDSAVVHCPYLMRLPAGGRDVVFEPDMLDIIRTLTISFSCECNVQDAASVQRSP